VCHALPIVRTLQSHWPDTRLTWVIGKTEASLVGDIPGVEFIIFDKATGWRGYRELRTRMQARHFDVLLIMQVSLRANVASLFIPASIRLGFDRTRSRDYQRFFITHQISGNPRVHVLDSFFQFLQALGIAERVLRWDIPISDAARAFCTQHVPVDRRILVINPCANVRWRNWRNWNVEGYAAVADYATGNLDLQVVLTGGPSRLEHELGQAIENRCKFRPINLIGKTGLKELLAVLDRADVLIAPDTGPAHMATSVGTPVIGLYAATNPARAAPYLSQAWVVDRYPEAVRAEFGLDVEQVPWGTRVRRPDVMNRISVRDVTERLDQLTAR
jgi:heptosyltransferase I